MSKTSRYAARTPDADGRVHYTVEEDALWAALYARQHRVLADRACTEFSSGLAALALPSDRVPQLDEVSRRLMRETGWRVVGVPALIPFARFFELLSQRCFPAATFMRRSDESDYLQEPDIFHELFGHAPMLANPWFAAFTERYGQLGCAASPEQRAFLARLYWFTVEFGLLQPAGGPLRIYGGGILSSVRETRHALESPTVERRRFALLDALRSPYRIDALQPLYFVLEDLRELEALTRIDLLAEIERARALGLHPAPWNGEVRAAPAAAPPLPV